MIDENKIKEAAKSLRKDFDDDVTQGFLVEFGFEKGANKDGLRAMEDYLGFRIEM